MTLLKDIDRDPIIGTPDDGVWAYAYSDLVYVNSGERIGYVETFATNGRYYWQVLDDKQDVLRAGESPSADIAIRRVEKFLGL